MKSKIIIAALLVSLTCISALPNPSQQNEKSEPPVTVDTVSYYVKIEEQIDDLYNIMDKAVNKNTILARELIGTHNQRNIVDLSKFKDQVEDMKIRVDEAIEKLDKMLERLLEMIYRKKAEDEQEAKMQMDFLGHVSALMGEMRDLMALSEDLNEIEV